MTGQGSSDDSGVELRLLVASRDLPFFEPTARHLLHWLGAIPEIRHKAVTADVDLTTPHPDAAALLDLLNRMSDDGLIDDWTCVDWDPEVVAEAMTRWYGSPTAPARGLKGRVNYPYIASIDACQSRFMLHLDSDLLYHPVEPAFWLRDALQLMDSQKDVAAVIPMSGVPQAQTARDWILGRRAQQRPVGPQWSKGTDFTSRHFLLDRHAIDGSLLPLLEWSKEEHWEVAMSRTIARRGLFRYTDLASEAYFMHPHRHNRNHTRYLNDLITLVENDRWPYRRVGRPWDITTEGRRFFPWRVLMITERLRGRLQPR